jgi:hypothetical protein
MAAVIVLFSLPYSISTAKNYIGLDYSPIANSYSDLVVDQKYACVDSFVLDSGIQLAEVPIAYKTWGRLSARCDNCLVLCHALTGSSDVEDWWGPLLGQGAAFDTSRFFVFCANVMGSPYGSASPITVNPKTGKIYGPDFPQTTIRDDIRLVLLNPVGPNHSLKIWKTAQASARQPWSYQCGCSRGRLDGRDGSTRVATMYPSRLRENGYTYRYFYQSQRVGHLLGRSSKAVHIW